MILLMRHAEKPPGEKPGPDLTTAGRARAQSLVVELPARYGAIDAIFATAPNEHSRRPLETVEPLAAALQLPIDQRFGKAQLQQLAGALPRQGTTLVCWVHEQLPELARALGLEPPFDPWPEEEYGAIWVV